MASRRMKVETSTTLPGRSYRQTKEVYGNQIIDFDRGDDELVPVAKAGTLTTRTDNDTGVVTLSPGHGFVTGDRLDIYWTVGGVVGSRRNMTVTMAGDVASIDLGAGDNLPIAASVVQLTKGAMEDVVFTGSNAVGVAIQGSVTKRSSFTFLTAANVTVFGITLAVGESYTWFNGSGVTNPFAGQAVTKVLMTHEDTAAAQAMYGSALYN